MKFQVSSRKSEILHFDGLLLSKSYKVSAKKVQKSCLITLKSDATFKEKLACGFKYDMRNLVDFHRTTQKSEIFTLMGSSMDTSICPKYIRFELRKYWGVMFYETEQWCKVWINRDLVVVKMAWGIGWTFIRALKSLTNCTLTFLSKVYISFS